MARASEEEMMKQIEEEGGGGRKKEGERGREEGRESMIINTFLKPTLVSFLNLLRDYIIVRCKLYDV